MAGGLKEVRDRIASVKNTQQITKAMKMVSAAKLRRAQEAIQRVRPYANKLQAMLANILSTLDGDDAGTSFGVERHVESACLVVVTSDRGLAGAFNTNIAKAAAARLEDPDMQRALRNRQLTIIGIGKKGYEYFKKRFPEAHFNTDFQDLTQNSSFEAVAKASAYLMEAFESGRFDRVDVVYSRFRNAAMQFPQAVQYLPVAQAEPTEAERAAEAPSMAVDYTFEPDRRELLGYLVPTILQTTFHSYVLDVAAGEHGARMTAMDKATDNADDILRDLKITYNKARQEVITSELAEIVGGAAALEG